MAGKEWSHSLRDKLSLDHSSPSCHLHIYLLFSMTLFHCFLTMGMYFCLFFCFTWHVSPLALDTCRLDTTETVSSSSGHDTSMNTSPEMMYSYYTPQALTF